MLFLKLPKNKILAFNFYFYKRFYKANYFKEGSH